MKMILLALAAPTVAAHMSLVTPPSRNAVDRALPQWSGGKWWPYEPNCTDPNPHWDPQVPSGCVPPGTDGWGCNCANGTSPCDVAQSCFWFSQGCTIGCETCDGGPSNPNTKDRCSSGMIATINAPELRTFERDVEALSPQDSYRYNPGRAPGFAPVYDSCGMAGGGPQQQGGEAKYTPTKFAKQGDLGTVVLPPAPTGIVWKRNQTAQTKWSIRANHGGYYSYRLCPAASKLDEECFRQLPLAFANSLQTLEFNDGTTQDIKGTYVSFGTRPQGSTWAMNPFPYSNAESPPEFDPPCNETADRTKTDTGFCSGRDPFNTLIVDTLVVPDVAPGAYVLSLRWDCEKSAQVWTNCADIEIE